MPVNLHGEDMNMEKISSFTIDHTRLLPGVYVSRRDRQDNCQVTTFDVRMTAPNREPVMDMPAIHTIEHLGATFLRSGAQKDKIVYFGPMGCRTGFYLILFGAVEAADVLPLVTDMCRFIVSYTGEIPGAHPDECGNYLEQNLEMAKYYAARYLKELTENPRTEYPA